MPPTLRKVDEDLLSVDLRTCRGAEWKDTLDRVRNITGRVYDPDQKLWLIPAESAHKAMISLNPIMEDDLKDWIDEQALEQSLELSTPLPDDADLLIPWATERAFWQPEYISVAGDRVEFKGLMKHQRPVVDLAADKRKMLICDDQGLGKCAMSLGTVAEAILRNRQASGDYSVNSNSATNFREYVDDPWYDKPKLIVCPKSVQGTWKREIKMWLGEEAVVVNKSTAKAREKQLTAAIENGDWIIVNWEQIQVTRSKVRLKNGGTKTTTVMKQPLFEKTDWLCVIADEIHRAKNRKTKTTQGLWRTRGDIMLGASGTPLMNDPSELWSILAWLWPDDYNKLGAKVGARAYWTFYDEYVDYTEGHFGKIINGVKNPDALRLELRNRLIRRTKGQVLDLPDKIRIPVELTLNPKQEKLYKEAEKALWLEVTKEAEEGDESAKKFIKAVQEGADRATLLKIPNGAARTVRLRQIIESPALLGGPDDSAVLDACVEMILDSQPNQWIVFTEFVQTTELLKERLEKRGLTAEVYTGAVESDARSELEQRFQDGDLDVLVGTIKAMNSGLTLTAGSNQFWCSRDWVPAINEQGEDRQHRISQTDKVLVYIAQPQNTVAVSKIEPTNRLKEHIVKTVIDKDDIKEKRL